MDKYRLIYSAFLWTRFLFIILYYVLSLPLDGYTTDDITYLWDNKDPVQLAKSLNLPRFNIEKYSSSYCNVKTNTGEYSCLTVDLVFKRQFSYYLITIYVPGCMLVIVSWVNFWLDPKVIQH